MLGKVGGQNYKETVRRVLQKILTDNFMARYSLVGHKKKKAFKGTSLFAVSVGEHLSNLLNLR